MVQVIPTKQRRAILEKLAPSLPAISSTEQEALDSGTDGFERGFLQGKADWNGLFELNMI